MQFAPQERNYPDLQTWPGLASKVKALPSFPLRRESKAAQRAVRQVRTEPDSLPVRK